MRRKSSTATATERESEATAANDGAPASHPLQLLSNREQQVLALVVQGRTSKEIAALLGLSPSSVDTYRSRLMLKLGVSDIATLVRLAIRWGVTSA